MIIDFHYHYLDKPDYIENLLKDMDNAEISITCISALENLFWQGTTVGSNEKVYEAVQKYPGRLVGCTYIDPRMPDACAIVDEYADKGFACIKMFPPIGFFPDDEVYYPVYERIAIHGLPLLFHAGLTGLSFTNPLKRQATNSVCAQPMHIDKVAKAFPEIPIVIAHMGYPYYMESWSLANIHPNVYLDISGIGASPWIAGAPIVYNAIDRFIEIDFKKIIWGSDNCLNQKESIQIAKKFLEQMGCAIDDFKYIFGDTSAKLLKLM